MRARVTVFCVLVLAAAPGCDRPGPSGETPDSGDVLTPAAAVEVAEAVAAPPVPVPRYPKASSPAGNAETSAFYPRPMLVHRCLNLVANGPAAQVESTCTQALRLEPWNEDIRAALATP